MSRITVAGAGAFGTALAIAFSGEGNAVNLWARDRALAGAMKSDGENKKYLPGLTFPADLSPTAEDIAFSDSSVILLAIPIQNLRDFLQIHRADLSNKTCVVCCKGIEKGSGMLPSEIVKETLPDAQTAVLTGPGFAGEIAAGKPTALTLASLDHAADLQKQLSTRSLRLYLSDDPIGAQLGGALKNVIAIACGIVIGANLGESARASLMTRGYAEILRLATDMGANGLTLQGLSGLGDLALTCTSMQSRNYALGYRLGSGSSQPSGKTVEGVATAQAVVDLARDRGIEMPIAQMVAAVLDKQLTIPEATRALLSRPLKLET